MVFSELAPNTPFYFGRVSRTKYINGEGYRNVEEAIRWRKTSDGGLSVNETEITQNSFDHKRQATGANRYERTHGQRLFSESSLCKYLNCRDTSWANVEQGDSRPFRGNVNGFLSHFSTEEVEFLQPHVITQKTPDGMTKKYGSSVSKSVLVGIPSIAQLNRIDGTFRIDTPSRYRQGWVTDCSTMSGYFRYDTLCKVGSDHTGNVLAVIKIKEDAPVDITEDGSFIIRIPEEDFNGDLNAFLGLAA